MNFLRLPHHPHAALEYGLADERGFLASSAWDVLQEVPASAPFLLAEFPGNANFPAHLVAVDGGLAWSGRC